MIKKVGICTDTEFNYGLALQCFATIQILNSLGYEGQIIKLSGSLIKGRDVRFKKAIIMAFRMLMHPTYAFKRKKTNNNDNSKLSNETLNLFDKFYSSEIKPVYLSERKLKKLAHTNDYYKFLCGSDQIWITTAFYVDPFYYLAFAPKNKRIAFSPSFGREYVPNYNIKKIKKYINNIPYLSVRELSGQKLIKDITGRNSELLVDPTLALSKNEWIDLLNLKINSNSNIKYVLAYFLNVPSKKALNLLNKLKQKGYKIITLSYTRDGNWFDKNEAAGPKEFLNYLLNASIVCTDSFHGTAFSINFQKEFYVFEREYGSADNQSTRLISLLTKCNLLNRYDRDFLDSDLIDFNNINENLKLEREKVKRYLKESLAYEVNNDE